MLAHLAGVDNWILGLLGGALLTPIISVILSIIGKKVPNKKLYMFTFRLGWIVSKFGMAKLKPKAWEMIERFFDSFLAVATKGLRDGMKLHNKEADDKKKDCTAVSLIQWESKVEKQYPDKK